MPLGYRHEAQSDALLWRRGPAFHYLQLLRSAAAAGHGTTPGVVSPGLGKYVLEQVRRRFQFVVVGYVVMPEHIHLLVSEPQVKTSSTVMQALKIGFARRVLARARRRNPAQAELFEGRPQHIWQKRFYDFNVWTARKRVEKLRYMHRNPVMRGLVASPELWRWSSFRAYAMGESGLVRVNDWTVLKLKIRPPAV
jgi:putative transposase